MQTQANTQILFDKLTYSSRLQNAGFSTAQTNALADAQHESLGYLIDTHLATKEDLEKLQRITKEDLNQLRQETKEDLNQLRQEMREGLEKLRHETVIEIRDVRYEIRLNMERGTQMFYKTTLSLGGMISIATAVIACIIKF